MNILLSAYACEPNKGSEPGVGWHWAIELANMGHRVWVITRANNQSSIEEALSVEQRAVVRERLQFVYYDLPSWARQWKKRIPGGVYAYYFSWQIGIYSVAKALIAQIDFDWVHHITFGGIRQPSFLAFLGVPFILGPLGGGERAPYSLRKSLPLRGRVLDFLRDFLSLVAIFDPIANALYRHSDIILCKTTETLACIPKRYHKKCRVHLEIGIDSSLSPVGDTNKAVRKDQPFRVLYVGRLIYWKGLHLGLRAFAQMHKETPHARLTVIGSGADSNWLHQIAEQLGINHAIDWIPWMQQDKVLKTYAEHDVFLFPSLHDSSGNVILESLVQALPVICLDLGGPGTLVNDTCGYVVPTAGASEATVIQLLAERLKASATHSERLEQLSQGAVQQARLYSWSELVRGVYVSLEP